MSESGRVLLHVCCAPCATACVERLQPDHEVVLLWYNPNITDPEEHERRLREARRYADRLGLELVILPHDPAVWEEAVRGLEDQPEGGRRCEVCFRLRLEVSGRVAREGGLPLFTTTLSVSPHKSFEKVRAAGEAAQGHGSDFVPEDFKKRGGSQRSAELAAEYGLYRQDFCGCEYSRRERDERRGRPRRPRPR